MASSRSVYFKLWHYLNSSSTSICFERLALSQFIWYICLFWGKTIWRLRSQEVILGLVLLLHICIYYIYFEDSSQGGDVLVIPWINYVTRGNCTFGIIIVCLHMVNMLILKILVKVEIVSNALNQLCLLGFHGEELLIF